MNKVQIKTYVKKHYRSVLCETNHGLRRQVIDLSLEQHGYEEDSLRYQLLTAQRELIDETLDKRSNPKRMMRGKRAWN